MFFLLSLLSFLFRPLCALSLAEQFQRTGYVEICHESHGAEAFDSLYDHFDKFIAFLRTNSHWAQKLYSAKERFIRSKARNFYSTDFFGFYDESEREKRNQISFYYSTHFHEFLDSHYPEFNQAPEILHFLEACFAMQKPHENLFREAANGLNLEITTSEYDHPPVLIKVIKYLPSYSATTPHYDGSAFSLFLDSTDNQSLLLSPYKSSPTLEDFYSPQRHFPRGNSMLLIPGAYLAEFAIFPTPHIVIPSGQTRYATVAFAMRPNYIPQKIELPSLPVFVSPISESIE